MTIKIGVLSEDLVRKRVMAIAKGRYLPKDGEPKIWFDSLTTLNEHLSSEVLHVLKVIREVKPESISDLCQEAKRTIHDVNSSLQLLEGFGFVKLSKQSDTVTKPVLINASFEIVYDLDLALTLENLCLEG
ncbi:hypothetical protein [Vibrio owensii]|uniref:HVO_A0114 family putative DNA-binding protein n=1 Tax=Vibrio harveyi group TaxID=717610 RepID=UPI003CC53FEC